VLDMLCVTAHLEYTCRERIAHLFSSKVPWRAARCPGQIGRCERCAMSAVENKAVVRKFFDECWNKGNLAVLDEIMEPEVSHNDEHITLGHWRRGISDWLTAFPDFRYHVDRLVAEGDIVAAKTHFTGTHRGVFHLGTLGPVPPTGKSIDEKEMFFFRLAEGKIVEIWVSWEDITHVLFAQQLGGDQPQAATTT